jgi:hypothetical protein
MESISWGGRQCSPPIDQGGTVPGGNRYPGPAEALERYRAVVEAFGAAEVKGAKNPYTSRNGHMFSFLDLEGTMAVRLPDDSAEEFLGRYDSGPVQQYGKTMRGYVSVPDELLARPDELVPWLEASWTWIGTLEPK